MSQKVKLLVKITEPTPAECEVEVDLAEIAVAIAQTAYRKHFGRTNASVKVAAHAKVTEQSLAVRNAHLALNHPPNERKQHRERAKIVGTVVNAESVS